LPRKFCINNLPEICNTIPAAVIAFDTNCRVLVFNKYAESFFGVHPSIIVGYNLHSVGITFGSEDQNIASLLTTGESIIDKELTITYNNTPYPVRLSVNPLYNCDGTITGALAILHDNSLVSLPEPRMQHLETLASIGEMTAGTIHEIRNPLTSISGFVQLLSVRAMRQHDETSIEYCRLISDEVTHINNILSDFLTLAKPQPNKFLKLNIIRPISDVLTLLYGEALMYGIDIKQNIDNETLYVMGNSEKIREVLINLCRNAFQAMTRGGTLTLTVKSDENAITTMITDTGHGMSLELIDNIFKPFFTTKETGTGLGLSVCQRIIREHNGQINVASKPGEGTTFTLLFPRLKE